jgi:hypothetical protein
MGARGCGVEEGSKKALCAASFRARRNRAVHDEL